MLKLDIILHIGGQMPKLTLYILLAISPLFAGPLDFSTISSQFAQTVTNEEDSKIIYKGNFYAKEGSKALWIYKEPIEKKIYFNDARVVIIEQELEQAIVTTLKNTPNLTAILQSAKKHSDTLYKAEFDDVMYDIHVKEGKIQGISYRDKLDNHVYIELKNQTFNSVLDDSLFQATIPKDFDIIQQ